MNLFEKTYLELYNKFILEAEEPMPMDDGESDEEGLNLPSLSELEGEPKENAGMDAKPEEYELAKLAIKSLETAGGVKINPKIYDDFEEGKNMLSILNYIEKKVNEKDNSTSYDNPKFYDFLGIKNLKGMSIGQKIMFFKNSSLPPELQLDGQRRNGWARIIINAVRHGYRDFAIDFVEQKMNNLELESLYQQLSVDLTFDTRGSDHDIQQKI